MKNKIKAKGAHVCQKEVSRRAYETIKPLNEKAGLFGGGGTSVITSPPFYLKCAVNDDLKWHCIKRVVRHDGRDKGFNDFNEYSFVIDDFSSFFDDIIDRLGGMDSVVDESFRLAWDHVHFDAGIDERYGLKGNLDIQLSSYQHHSSANVVMIFKAEGQGFCVDSIKVIEKKRD